MHVLEKATGLACGWLSRAKEAVVGKDSFVAHIVNGTAAELTVCGESLSSGCSGVPFAVLRPGEAGAVRFSGDGGYSGSLLLSIAGSKENLFIRASRLKATGGCNCNVEITTAGLRRSRVFAGLSRPFGKGKLVDRVSGKQHAALCSWGMAPSFASGAAKEGFATQVDPRSPGGLTLLLLPQDSVPKSLGELGRHLFLAESLSGPQLASFVESLKGTPDLLGCGMFISEHAAMLRALPQMGLRDEAFALDLLVEAFAAGAALGGDVPSKLAGTLERWRAARPELLPPRAALDYEEYAQLPEDTLEQLLRYTDAAHSVLRAAALLAARALEGAVAAYSGFGDESPQQIEPSIGRTPSIPRGVDNTAILSQHLRGSEEGYEVAASPSKRKGSAAVDLPSLVKHCIGESAALSLRRRALLDTLEASLPDADARSRLKRFRQWLPSERREFQSSASNGRPAVRFSTFGMDLFAGLDGGSVATPERLLQSLGPDSLDFKSMSTNSRSGEFFFFSGDRRFLIKTVSDAEGELLHRMLPAYQSHLRRLPRSFIVRYAGLFRVQVEGGFSKYFTIMASVFDSKCQIHETYDVKGSLFGRRAKPGESIGKDSDWFDSGRRLKLPVTLRREMLAIHEADCNFLASFKVMDYSLLIGVHKLAEDAKYPGPGLRDGGGLWAEGSREIYFVGVIDFLIGFGLKKEAEHVVRTVQGHGEDASCVHPDDYARRQVTFVKSKIFEDPEDSMGTLGVLKISGVSANNLINTDGLLDVSDPYLRVDLGMQSFRTTTVQNNLNPEWTGQEILVPVHLHHTAARVLLSLWDADDNARAIRGADDFLGKTSIPVQMFIRPASKDDDAQRVERVERLQGVKHGELKLTIVYVPGEPITLEM